MTPADPLTLARAVIARGHIGTEAHQLAVALLEQHRRAEVAEARLSWRDALDLAGGSTCSSDACAAQRAMHEAEARLRALGVEP